jgi:hypothetical protein
MKKDDVIYLRHILDTIEDDLPLLKEAIKKLL